jgi:hypothetical protein
MSDRQTCVDCQKPSPETDTNYTLISAQYGWRLHRATRPDGTHVMEWRCPSCWVKFKEASGAPPSSRRPVPRPNEAAAAPFQRATFRLLDHPPKPPRA